MKYATGEGSPPRRIVVGEEGGLDRSPVLLRQIGKAQWATLRRHAAFVSPSERHLDPAGRTVFLHTGGLPGLLSAGHVDWAVLDD